MSPLEAAQAHVPGCGPGGVPPRLQALAGGLSNRAFRVTGAAGDFVLRLGLPAERARRLGVDRTAEIAAQRAAASVGIAPELVFADASQGILVMEFVHGVAPPAAGRCDAAWQADLLRLFRVLRAIPVPADVPLVSLPARLLELHARLRACDPAAALALAGAVADGLDGWRAAGVGHGAPCLVHSDPKPANILRRADGRVVLLDWEYAHAGDPLEDPAAAGLPAEACGVDAARLDGVRRCQQALALVWDALRAAATGAAGSA